MQALGYFRYPRLLQYAGIENHVRKYILKQQITFSCLRKGNTIALALPLALHTGPYHAAVVTKCDYNTWLSDLSANRIVFPRTGDCNVSFAESGVEDCLELNFKYVDYQSLAYLSYSSCVCWISVRATRAQHFLSVRESISASSPIVQ